MAINILNKALAEKYASDTAVGLGAVKGAPCTIESIVEVDGGNKITFSWTGDDGTRQENVVVVKDGQDGHQGYSPTISENKNNTDDVYKLDITDVNGTITTPNLKCVIDNLIPVKLIITKVKTNYQQDEKISLEDMDVLCVYNDNSTSHISNYSTNIDTIDTSFAGYKELQVVYCHNGISVSGKIGINISLSDSYNGIQLAYKLSKYGILTNGINVVSAADKIYQYGNLRLRMKIRVTIEENSNSGYTTIGLGNYGIWGSVTTGQSKVINPKWVGQFELDTDNVFDFEKSNISPGTSILNIYNNGGNKVQGYFEIIGVSLAYTQPVKNKPVSITATKDIIMSTIGESLIIDDIVATVTYNTETTADVSDSIEISEPENIIVGKNNITVSYSENEKTVSTIISIKYFDTDKTTVEPFTDMTAREWLTAGGMGINIGNTLDSKANGNNLIPGDTSHKGDAYYTNPYQEMYGVQGNQETYWGQPIIDESMLQAYWDAGFRMLRVPCTWCYNSYLDENGVRHIGKYWLKRVQEVVNMCISKGFYVLLNCHHEQPIFFLGTTQSKLDTVYQNVRWVWKEIAEAFKYYDHHLAFEACNEVDNLAQSWSPSIESQQQQNEFNQIFVDTVRETGFNNSKRVLCCPTIIHNGSKTALSSYVVPNDTIPDHITFAVHDYTNRYLQDININFDTYSRYADLYNIPMNINEWGIETGKYTEEYCKMHTKNFVSRAKHNDLFAFAWDDGATFQHITKPRKITSNIKWYPTKSAAMLDGRLAGFYDNKANKIDDNKTWEWWSDSNSSRLIKTCPSETNMFTLDDNTGNILGVFLNYSDEKGFYDSSWGTICMRAFDVNPGDNVSIQSVQSGSFADYCIWQLSSVSFYTSDYKYLSSITPGWHVTSSNTVAPDDAAYCIVKFNCADKNVKYDIVSNAINNGEWTVACSSYKDSDVVEIVLDERNDVQNAILTYDTSSVKYLETGSNLDVRDLLLTTTYNDGYYGWNTQTSRFPILVDSSDVDMNTTGRYPLHVTWERFGEIKFSEDIYITVGDLVSSISASSSINASKINEELPDLTPLINVVGTKVSGSTEELSGFTVDSSNINILEEGSYNITVSWDSGSYGTFTCTIPWEIYTKLLLKDTDSNINNTYGKTTDSTVIDTVGENPNFFRIDGWAPYMYAGVFHSANCIYSDKLTTNFNTDDINIYIPGKSVLITTASWNLSGTIQSKKISDSQSQYISESRLKITIAEIEDSIGRIWSKITVHVNKDGVESGLITNSTPIYYTSESELGSIVLNN